MRRAGGWLVLNTFERVRMFWDNKHPKTPRLFKLALFEGSDNTIVAQTVACLEKSMEYSEGN